MVFKKFCKESSKSHALVKLNLHLPKHPGSAVSETILSGLYCRDLSMLLRGLGMS